MWFLSVLLDLTFPGPSSPGVENGTEGVLGKNIENR